MSTLPAPAPIWRRFAASGYDGLLLLALWMTALSLDVVIRSLFDAPREWTVLRAFLFGIGLAFFGWFWTHGGQTLGMRVWRLRVQRDDGRALSWPAAMSRYAATLACWTAVLVVPLIAPLSRLPHLREAAYALPAAIGITLAVIAGLVAMRLDRHRRGPQDWISGSRVLLLPPRAKS